MLDTLMRPATVAPQSDRVAAESSAGPGRTVRVVAVVPAHNEAASIATTIASLRRQCHGEDRIVVVADNCTDDTVEVARAAGAEVVETVGNVAKKAGALNQVLGSLLPTLGENDFVLAQDADSVLDPGFITTALRHLSANPRLAAVGGTFRGQEGGGLIGHLQRNEYARYARDVRRLKGHCLVVTGTAAMLAVPALWAIARGRRSGALPPGDGRGGVYDTSVLTEDNELTFALMHLGYQVLSPKGCTLTTEVMPTWRDLWNQRLRWKRGAVENCVQYGLTRVTRPYWGRQVVTVLGLLVTAAYLGSVVWSLAATGGLRIAPFWLGVTAIFALERGVTLRDRGWVRQLAAVTLYELPYEFFMQACHGKAYVDSLLNRERRW